MRIDGEWYECDDGALRPVVLGAIRNAHGAWEPAPFLVDTGADCTVFSAALLDVLDFAATAASERIGGVGGTTESVRIATQIRLPRDDGNAALFRGEYAALMHLESLDMSVLGRDILDLFAVIVDRPGDAVTLIREPHQYAVDSARI